MRTFHAFLLLTLLIFASTQPAMAQDAFTIAAGAGYKQLVTELGKAYEAKTGTAPQQIYGNMGQVSAQAKNSGVVDLVIGDKNFLDNADLAFSEEYFIGKGRLILAVAKGVDLDVMDGLTTLDTESGEALLTDPAVTRIAHSDTKKAIYGRAATQFLNNAGLAETLAPKLLMVGTVPQVSTYVVNGEVDLGFINLTDALAFEDRVALLIPVDETLYSPILIVAKTLADAPAPEAATAFGAFLQTDTARGIAAKHGL